MIELFANNGDPDQMPHSAVPDLNPHCLPITLLGVSRLQWVNMQAAMAADNILKYFFFFFLLF